MLIKETVLEWFIYGVRKGSVKTIRNDQGYYEVHKPHSLVLETVSKDIAIEEHNHQVEKLLQYNGLIVEEK